MDEILRGKEIYISLLKDSYYHNENVFMYVNEPYRVLFRWKQAQPPAEKTQITLKEALALVDEHWQDRWMGKYNA